MQWLADYSPSMSAVDGVIELSIAVLIALGIRKRMGKIPSVAWLVVGYFVLEAFVSFNRYFVEQDPDGTLARATLLDIVGTFAILVMIVNASKIVDAVNFIVDQARFRAAEYDRARSDYQQVVRHRINNPLTVIKGAAQTLEAGNIDEPTRHELRKVIIEAAEALEKISLEPERQGAEERDLDAVPRIV